MEHQTMDGKRSPKQMVGWLLCRFVFRRHEWSTEIYYEQGEIFCSRCGHHFESAPYSRVIESREERDSGKGRVA